ncbi:class I SAM-dependent methyltransferase [Shewanella waksmanii]|uniref:class I SAM-dependent methyltransferase n=1 Tax=Shewanella waksmanii TaxID=213783 RepID=UPI00373534A3
MQLFLDAVSTFEFSEEVTRLFHGRGGCFPGSEHINVDYYPPVILLTSFTDLADDELQLALSTIKNHWTETVADKPCNLVYQYRHGGQTQTRLLCGEVPEPHVVTEHGCQFQVHLLRGQNHGLFVDMRNGRHWVKHHAQDKKVLNLFAYTCGFSVAAMQGGAVSTVNIDMSKGALAIGKQNHLLNGFDQQVKYLGHDIFKSWGKLTKFGPYDLIIADPPSNQRGSFVATKDYARLLKRLPSLLAEGGEVLLCLNAPELSLDFLKSQVAQYSPTLVLVEQIANPPVFKDINPDKALKVLRYRQT